MKLNTGVVFSGLILVSNCVLSEIVTCPESIDTNQSLGKKIEGWDGFLDDLNNVHYFNRITFYSEHPKMHASLAPDDEHTKGNNLTWTFGAHQIWLACGYYNTDVQLIRQLSNSIDKCTVTYQANFSKVTAINCHKKTKSLAQIKMCHIFRV